MADRFCGSTGAWPLVWHIPLVDAVDTVPQLHLTVYFLLLELPETCNISHSLPYVAFEFAHNFIANGKWRLRHITTVTPVFEQAKPVLTAAVSLICMILNLVNHKSKIKHQLYVILLESGHDPYLRIAILK